MTPPEDVSQQQLDDGTEPSPLPVVEPGTKCWHYTDGAGLLGILNSTRFWATAPRALNDLSEVKHGLQLLHETWEGMRGHYTESQQGFMQVVMAQLTEERVSSDLFVLSTSASDDILNQWQHYAHRGGYALGINTDAPLEVERGVRPVPSTRGFAASGWYRVLYGANEKRAAAENVLDLSAKAWGRTEPYDAEHPGQEIALSDPLRNLSTLAHLLKHEAFEPEREIRYLAVKDPNDSPEQYRLSQGQIVPYVPLKPLGLWLPIFSVTIGPGASADKALVQRLFRSHHFPSMPIAVSDIPLR